MNIGDVFGGGIVVHIYEDGETLLIGSLVDISSGVKWQVYNGDPNTITNADDYYDGVANTDKIVSVYGDTDKVYAAYICKNLTQNGYSDWWLPSAQELIYLLQNKSFFKVIRNDTYWSSQEASAPYQFNAIACYAQSATAYQISKVNKKIVRAVRKANINDIELEYDALSAQPITGVIGGSRNGQIIFPLLTDAMEISYNGVDWLSPEEYTAAKPLDAGTYTFRTRFKPTKGFKAGDIQSFTLNVTIPGAPAPDNGEDGSSGGGETSPPTAPATDGMTDATTALRTAYIKLIAPLIVNNITVPVYANEVNDTVSPYDRDNPPKAYITISNQNFVENSIKQKFVNTHSIQVDVWTYYPAYNGDSEFCEAINSAVLSRIRSTTWGALQVDGYHCYQGAVSLSRQQNEITGTSNIYRRITIFTHQIEEI